MCTNQHKGSFPSPTETGNAGEADIGEDAATVVLAYEVARDSFPWDPALGPADRNRVVTGLLWSVGRVELPLREWTERVRALQEVALRERGAASAVSMESAGEPPDAARVVTPRQAEK